MKTTLVERIENKIEREALNHGIMGTETVSVHLQLSDVEMEEFQDTGWNYFDTPNYGWEINGDELFISYTEELS